MRGKILLLKLLWLTCHLFISYKIGENWQMVSGGLLVFFLLTIALLSHLTENQARYKKKGNAKLSNLQARIFEKINKDKTNNLRDACIILALASLFVTWTDYRHTTETHQPETLPHFLLAPQHSLLIRGKIDRIYKASDKLNEENGSYRLQLLDFQRLFAKDSQATPLKPPAYIYLQTKNPLWIGQLIPGCQFQFVIFKKRAIRNPPDNGFGEYLKKNKMQGILYVKNNIRNLDCSHPSRYGKTLLFLREKLKAANFSPDALAVTLGMLLGNSGYLPKELKEQGRELGILHLFAASGLHLGILYIMFHLPLSIRYGKKSKIALLIPLITCLCYLFLLDFPVSLTRAFTFIVLYTIAALGHFRLAPANLIINTAIILFLFMQNNVIASLGSLLSFGAVSGILFFYPVLEKTANDLWQKKSKIFDLLLKQLFISVSASLGTALSILIFFQSYSFFAIVANVILVPLASLLLPLVVSSLLFFLIVFSVRNGLDLLFESSFMVGQQFHEITSLALLPLQLSAIVMGYFVQLTQTLHPYNLFRNYSANDIFLSPPMILNFLLILLLFGLRFFYQHQANSLNATNQRYKRIFLLTIASLILLIGPLGALFY